MVLAAPLLLVGSPASAAQPAQPSGTLVIDLTADPESLDPAIANQAAGFSVISSIFDNLVERDYQGQLRPMLAESWSFPSPTTIEFKLRHGVTFQNGEPFNAASVKFSVDRLLDPATELAAGRWVAQDVPGRDIVDDYTVDFNFSAPDATIFDALAVSGAMLPPQSTQPASEPTIWRPTRSAPARTTWSSRSRTTTPRSRLTRPTGVRAPTRARPGANGHLPARAGRRHAQSPICSTARPT